MTQAFAFSGLRKCSEDKSESSIPKPRKVLLTESVLLKGNSHATASGLPYLFPSKEFDPCTTPRMLSLGLELPLVSCLPSSFRVIELADMSIKAKRIFLTAIPFFLIRLEDASLDSLSSLKALLPSVNAFLLTPLLFIAFLFSMDHHVYFET